MGLAALAGDIRSSPSSGASGASGFMISPNGRGLMRVSEVGEEGLDEPEGGHDINGPSTSAGEVGLGTAAGQSAMDSTGTETAAVSCEDGQTETEAGTTASGQHAMMAGALPTPEGGDVADLTPAMGNPSGEYDEAALSLTTPPQPSES